VIVLGVGMIVLALGFAFLHAMRRSPLRLPAYWRLAGWVCFGVALVVNSTFPMLSGALVIGAAVLALTSIVLSARSRQRTQTPTTPAP
jgi:hypothetical protein